MDGSVTSNRLQGPNPASAVREVSAALTNGLTTWVGCTTGGLAVVGPEMVWMLFQDDVLVAAVDVKRGLTLAWTSRGSLEWHLAYHYTIMCTRSWLSLSVLGLSVPLAR